MTNKLSFQCAIRHVYAEIDPRTDLTTIQSSAQYINNLDERPMRQKGTGVG